LGISDRKCFANALLLSFGSSSHELFCNLTGSFDTSPPPSFLQLLAADIFSNFLRALVLKNSNILKDKFGFLIWDKVLTKIENHLMGNKVCATLLDAKLAIIPALLTLGIKQGEAQEPKQADDIGEKSD
jgi:hypothetical protein